MVQTYKKYLKEEKISKDFKIALGNEIYLIDDLEDYRENYNRETHSYYHFLLAAKDEIGFKALKELSSTAWSNAYTQNGMQRVPLSKKQLSKVMTRYKGHIVASTACLGGELPQQLLKLGKLKVNRDVMGEERKKQEIVKFIEYCQDTFGKDNFFFEVQPNMGDEQVYVNQMIRVLAQQMDVKIIYTTDSHYTSEQERTVHKAFLNSMDGEREVDAFYSTAYMMDKEEVFSFFEEYVPREEFEIWTDNTNYIHSQIEIYDLYQPQEIPEIEVYEFPSRQPSIEEQPYENLVEMLTEGCRQDRYWVNTCINVLKEKDLYNETYLKRLDDEAKELLEISTKLDITMTQYYNTMQKIIQIVWDAGDSLVGPARGSATGFLSCYLLDITQVDPVATNLPYWRHLSATRPELPDIDFDTEQNKRNRILYAMQEFFNKDVPEMQQHLAENWNVLNIATFGTEASRSAVITACRGYTSEDYPEGIDSEIAQYLTGMIPSERGKTRSLSECIFGDPEKEIRPLADFNREIAKYPGLQEIMLSIEGLVNKVSSHASGIYIYNNGFLEHNVMMKTRRGAAITQFNMDDSDYMGSLKYDFLTIEALDKIRVAMDLLIEDGFMTQQETLKATYDKYLHPDVLEYDNQELWKVFGTNEVVNLFQFDTPVGALCVKKIQPKNLIETAAANSLMRLMAGRGEEQPIDRFIRFKEDKTQWDMAMMKYGLSEDERNLMYHYLDDAHGVAATQEDLMEIVMDPRIANFNLTEANKLRKGIARIQAEVTAEVKEMFYEKGLAAGTRKEFLDYVWEAQVTPQLGYSFSRNHTTPYSIIALQEVYLYHEYPSLYWNTACLTVNAQSMDADEVEGVETVAKSTDYKKMATAIGNMQSYGVNISLPDINKSSFGFKVDLEGERILFGLKAITRIGDDLVNEIIENRPYKSMDDFREKVNTNVLQMLNLIKAGSFDALYPDKTREEIMKEFIRSVSNPKNVLNLRNFNGLIEADLVPEELEFTKRVFGYSQILKKHFKEGEYFLLENEQLLEFFNEHFDSSLLEIVNNNYAINQKVFDKEIYQPEMDNARNWLKEDQENMLEKYNNHLFNEQWEKYGEGNLSSWEMDSVSFYYHDHELAHVDKEKYGVDDFEDLPYTPEVEHWYKIDGKEIPIFKLTKIVGTVISKQKTNGTIALLTTNEVITVRFRKPYFALFDKQISEHRADGTKRIAEKSWFSKGNKLMITGYRREDQFVPKTYSRTPSHTLYLIEDVDEAGNMKLRSER